MRAWIISTTKPISLLKVLRTVDPGCSSHPTRSYNIVQLRWARRFGLWQILGTCMFIKNLLALLFCLFRCPCPFCRKTIAFNMTLFFVWHLGKRSNCQRQTEDGKKTMQLTFVAPSCCARHGARIAKIWCERVSSASWLSVINSLFWLQPHIMSCGMLWNHLKSVKSFPRRCKLLSVTESDGNGKPTPGKAFYGRAHHNNLQRYYLYQNDHDAKLYRSLGACSTCSWDSLTSFLKKTLENTCTENVAICPKLRTSFQNVQQEKEILYFAACWP